MNRPYLNLQEQEVKSGYIKMLRGMPQKTTYAVTLSTNSKDMNWLPESVSNRRDMFDRRLSQWDKILCRKFIGRNYHKEHRRHERQSGFAFPEKFDSNPHYHLILDIRGWPKEEFIKQAEEVWIQQWEPATVDIQHLYGIDWEMYSTKDFQPNKDDSWIPIPYVPPKN